jgi:hypothetical protein
MLQCKTRPRLRLLFLAPAELSIVSPYFNSRALSLREVCKCLRGIVGKFDSDKRVCTIGGIQCGDRLDFLEFQDGTSQRDRYFQSLRRVCVPFPVWHCKTWPRSLETTAGLKKM